MSIDPHNLDCNVPQGAWLGSSGDTQGSSRLVVLVVEDDPDTARILERFVQSWGHTPIVVSSCNEARAAVGAVRFDVVLCDIQLPDGDGVDLVAEMRRTQWFPCLAMTGHAAACDVERYRGAGIAHVLTKPFDAEALKVALTSVSHSDVVPTQ